jgi:hypothetical protein
MNDLQKKRAAFNKYGLVYRDKNVPHIHHPVDADKYSSKSPEGFEIG